MLIVAGEMAGAQGISNRVASDELQTLVNRTVVFAGPSFVSLRGNQDIELGREVKVGYAVGFCVDHPFNRNLYSSVRFFYERKGHRQRFDFDYYDPDQQGQVYRKQGYESRYDYLILAPMLYYQTEGPAKIIAGAGGFAGYLLKQELTTFELTTGYVSTNDYTDRHKQFDFGLSFMLGVKLSFSGSILSAHLEDHLGLFNISDFSQPQNINLKTNSLILLLGFTLPKKKIN